MPPVPFHLPRALPVSATLYPAAPAIHGAVLVLAHGAGAGQHSPFITRYATELAARGVAVVTFNFRYMEQHRKAPDRPPVLGETFRDIVAAAAAHPQVGAARVFIGGKSMGGRIATHLAAAPGDWPLAEPLRGVVVFGYPLRPPGGHGRERAAHLLHLSAPTLIVQGTRDRFGGPDEIRAATAGAANLEVLPVEGGDHSFAVLKRSGRDQESVHRDICDEVSRWVQGRSQPAATP